MRLIDPKKPTNRLYVSDFVMEQMQRIPTIEAEPVMHGRWIEFNTFMTCSECDKDFYYADNNCDEFDYCPNCGAKMDGGST